MACDNSLFILASLINSDLYEFCRCANAASVENNQIQDRNCIKLVNLTHIMEDLTLTEVERSKR